MLTIMGIDPGTANMGVACLGIDEQYCSVRGLTSATLSPVENLDYIVTDDQLYMKIQVMKSKLRGMLEYYRPDYVAIETPFFNRLRPTAFGPLMELFHATKTTILEFNPGCTIRTFSPSQIKTGVNANAIGGKDDVRSAIMQYPEVYELMEHKINLMSEHEVDAVAAAYCFLRLLREFPTWAF